MLKHALEFHSFLGYNILLHVYITICLSIYLLMDTWFFFFLILLATVNSKYFTEHLFRFLLSILGSINLGVEWIGDVATLNLVSWWITYFPILPFHNFTFPPTRHQNSSFSSSSLTFIFIFKFYFLVSCEVILWYLILVLICISLSNDVEHLFKFL